jgi:hypothetical protein
LKDTCAAGGFFRPPRLFLPRALRLENTFPMPVLPSKEPGKRPKWRELPGFAKKSPAALPRFVVPLCRMAREHVWNCLPPMFFLEQIFSGISLLRSDFVLPPEGNQAGVAVICRPQ